MATEAPETIAVPLYSSAEAAALPIKDPEVGTSASSTETSEPPALPTMSLKDVVRNCRKAFDQAHARAKACGCSDGSAQGKAEDAYIAALPLLTSAGNIRAFVACIGYALSQGYLFYPTCRQLMSTARAAFSMLPRESRSPGRPRKDP